MKQINSGILLNQEWLARFLLLILALGLPAAVLVQRWSGSERVVELHAVMPEEGGWLPGNLTAQVGEPLHLRLTSDDVVHGFAVGPGEGPHYEVKPGEITEATFLFDQPGTYTYYCTRWCGPNHWRMRGTIEVIGESPLTAAGPNPEPLYLSLEIDLDAPHKSESIPSRPPSAAQGAVWANELPAAFWRPEVYRQQSPAQVWQRLGQEPSLAGLSDDQRWDLVAFVWHTHTSDETLEQGRNLYRQQCAACHGEAGAGDGVMAPAMTHPAEGHGLQPSSDFTDPALMLGASSALLHGKTARGGMGTGMPNWGTIFSDAQIWALVDYLWRFQFP